MTARDYFNIALAFFLFSAITFFGAFSGCKLSEQVENLTPYERAAKVDQELLETLVQIKDEVDYQWELYKRTDNNKGIAYITDKVAPAVKKAEKAIGTYHEAVMFWSEYDRAPDDIEARKQAALAALDTLERVVVKMVLDDNACDKRRRFLPSA